MRKSTALFVASQLAHTLAFWLCATAMNAVHAGEGIFWEASAPGRPDLLLMPTVHTLPDPAEDVSTVLVQALLRVNSVVVESPLEAVTPAEKAAIQQREKFPASDSLESHLDRPAVEELHVCAEKAHLPYGAVIQFRPWVLTLLVMHRVKQPTAYSGIDQRVYRGALAAYRDLSTLLNTEENIDFLGALPLPLQMLELREACNELDKTVDNGLIRVLSDDWRRGDIDALAADVYKPIQPEDTPALAQVNDFIYSNGTDRYFPALMSERIQSMKGPILVAVGAGHLVGRYSMLPRLQKAGYLVRRVTLSELPIIPFPTNVATDGLAKQSNAPDH